jgi:hypothetical protein
LAFKQIAVQHFNVRGCLLYKLSEFLTSLIKISAYFIADRKFNVLVEGKLFTPRKIVARVPQNSVLPPVFYSLYKNDAPAAPGTHLAVIMDDTCIYMTQT